MNIKVWLSWSFCVSYQSDRQENPSSRERKYISFLWQSAWFHHDDSRQTLHPFHRNLPHHVLYILFKRSLRKSSRSDSKFHRTFILMKVPPCLLVLTLERCNIFMLKQIPSKDSSFHFLWPQVEDTHTVPVWELWESIRKFGWWMLSPMIEELATLDVTRYAFFWTGKERSGGTWVFPLPQLFLNCHLWRHFFLFYALIWRIYVSIPLVLLSKRKTSCSCSCFLSSLTRHEIQEVQEVRKKWVVVGILRLRKRDRMDIDWWITSGDGRDRKDTMQEHLDEKA